MVRSGVAAVLVVGGLGLIAGACGPGHASAHRPAAPVTAAGLLRRSRAVVDRASSAHFVLAGSHVSGKGVAITGGSGDLVRPDELRGAFTVADAGLTASVGVVETGGRFYAKPPFAAHYSVTNPATYGLGDPAALLSPRTGVSSLLTRMADPRLDGSRRVSGELVDVVTGTVPGRLVPVLPDLRRSTPVRVSAAIDPASGQLRTFTLTGPFTSATAMTTYTVTLSSYDEHVTVTAPET